MCVLLHFDTLSGCKDTYVEALFSEPLTYVYTLNSSNLALLIVRHLSIVVRALQVLPTLTSSACADSVTILGWLGVTEPLRLFKWLQEIQRLVNKISNDSSDTL